MRREVDAYIGCELNLRERETVDAMKAQTGLHSDADLVRTALYRFAKHLDVKTDTALFAVRQARNSAGARRAKA